MIDFFLFSSRWCTTDGVQQIINMKSIHMLINMMPLSRLGTLLSMLTILWLTIWKYSSNRHGRKALASLTKENLNYRYASDDQSLFIDDKLAVKISKKVKILCWITTQESAMKTKVKTVNSTWAKRCDKMLYVVTGDTTKETKDGVLKINVPDGRNHLTAKTVQVLKYVHNHYLNRFDWFLKADDDTFIVVENLKFLLSKYNPKKPIYLGHLFKKYSKYGYMSGGAGYVLSRNALGILVKKGYKKKNKCKEDGGDEDVEIAQCLQYLNIVVYNTLDSFGRESFHPFGISTHIVGPEPAGLTEWDRNKPQIGRNCCSQLLISFHYVKPDMMLIIEHLLYRTSVYGRKVEETGLQDLFEIGPVPPLDKWD
ncbi:hypothetical protein LOTGIDRAFT_170451 [Lottia gigantea]|uniref:N-acetylgalactosaminide beta-1,3-galactosyltransferase n=1 Tax=Lottia gigantea TaxID=225164 RepID=V3ZM53_LOTGI|nr:hypothetical protein LOTGIDRAFT_170451 [Lottia gigantea]ESO81906.1 hypothetical protein LOTGIDRAFT_170451 [Lottia gigantea]